MPVTPMIRVGALVLLLLGSGCEADNPKLDVASKAIEESAETCLKTVRDSGSKYSETPSCNALGALSMQYLEAAGPKDRAAKYELRYASAQRMAWTAVAFSESCSRTPPRIW